MSADTDNSVERHDATWKAMRVLTELSLAEGWLSTREVAVRVGLGEDNVRRMLRTFMADRWVECETADNKELWLLGTRLPQIGLRFQEQLTRRAEALAARQAELLKPLRREA